MNYSKNPKKNTKNSPLTRGAGGLFFKKLFCSLLVFVFVFGGLVGVVMAAKKIDTADEKGTKASFKIDLNAIFREADRIQKEKRDEAMSAFFKMSVITALDTFIQNFAKQVATALASAAKGQKPLRWGEDYKVYLKKSADLAAGNFIEDFASTGGFGYLVDGDLSDLICKPDISMRLKLAVGLFEIEKPRKPKCTFSEMVNNWDEAVNDPDFLKNFSASFEPQQNDIGKFFIMRDKYEKQKAKEREAAIYKRGFDSFAGIKGMEDTINKKTNMTSGDTMSKILAKDNAAVYRYFGISETLSEAKGGEVALVMGMKGLLTFAGTLANELIKELGERIGTYSLDDVNWDEIEEKIGGGGGSSLTDATAQDTSGGKLAAEARYSKYVKTTLTDTGTYSVLSELSSCDSSAEKPGPTTCAIDNNFSQAITNRSTAQEALDNGLLDGNKIFGFDSDGKEPSYLEGYPYRSLVILRKYRIIPVGWELAAQYIANYGGGETQTLNSLMAAYDDSASPYYRLIDPDWVLKLPAGNCKARGAGPEILSEIITAGNDTDDDGDWDDDGDTPPTLSINRNDQYCADEQSCIKEKIDGTCGYYGYCMEERRLWKFEGEACEETYNTCQIFNSPKGTIVSYLKNSLDWDDCSVDNSGCQWYCGDFNPQENALTSSGAVAYWSMDELSNNGATIVDESASNKGILKDDCINGGGICSGGICNGGTEDEDSCIENNNKSVNGKWGKALDFDGSSDYVEVVNNPDLYPKTGSFTATVWARVKNFNGGNRRILITQGSNGVGYYLMANGADSFMGGIVQSGSLGKKVEPGWSGAATNTWYHLALVRDTDNSLVTLYINGTPQSSLSETGLIDSGISITNNTPLYIGSNTGVGEFFDGNIDEVAIYDRALSAEEIWNNYISYNCLTNNDEIYISGSANACDADESGCSEYLALETGLVSYWQLDKGEGSVAYDSSGYRNEGALKDACINGGGICDGGICDGGTENGNVCTNTGDKWLAGQSGQALGFDGIDDYVDLGNDPSLRVDTLTISAWVKPNGADELGYILAKTSTGTADSGYSLYWKGDEDKIQIKGTVSADQGSEAVFVDDNVWTHVAVTVEGDNIKFYRNGALAGEAADAIPNSTAKVYIGNRENGANATTYFNGAIDEAAIYNRALSASEISSIYGSGINFSSKYTKAANKNLHCFGRTSGDAIFDLPSYVDNCISLGARYDSFGQGTCFEFLAYNNEDDCASGNGVWSNTAIKIPRHTVQSYCEASGGAWVSGGCQTQCLRLDDSVCDNYAFACKAEEQGCEKYTPTAGGPWIPGIISDDDLCPAECAGYDTYKQEATNFETSNFPINFIPDTAQSCSSAAAGCDEFTNLEAAGTGGEGLEYYTYLRQCEKVPTASTTSYQCGNFYTWVGSNATGYQLQSYYLKSDTFQDLNNDGSINEKDEEPVEILRVEENLGNCDNANDALTNPNCKEFYNSKNVISYHLLKKTITCSNDCIAYRKTVPAEFNLERICANIGGSWNNPLNRCDIDTERACKAVSGSWSGSCTTANIVDSVFCANANYLAGNWSGTSCTRTDYQAILSEGITCPASANGCREYTGNTGSNIENVFEDKFESNSDFYGFPDAGKGWTNSRQSSESTIAGQNSTRVNNVVSGGIGETITKWLSASCELGYSCTKDKGCDCTEAEFDSGVATNDDDGDGINNEVVCLVALDKSSCAVANYTYHGSTYLLSFWAKGNNSNGVVVCITDDADCDYTNDTIPNPDRNTQYFNNEDDKDISKELSAIILSDQWQFYTIGPVEFNVENWNNYQLVIDDINSNGGTAASLLNTYFDNVRLEAVSSNIYKIKDSWSTPASCDQDPEGNSYLYYMLGCDEYRDSQTNLHYLKSFSNLCRSEAVGCQQLIDTHNSDGAFAQTWHLGDASEITVPADNFVYLAPTNENSCSSSAIACSALGQPTFNQDKTIVKGFNTVYKINDPDLYGDYDGSGIGLCWEENVGCQTFSAGSSQYYFKDPGDQICEYVQPAGVQAGYDWYKKADSYDTASPKCPLSDYQNFNVDYPAGTCVGGTENGKECLSSWDNYLEDKCINDADGAYCDSGGTCVSSGSQNGATCLSWCAAGGGYCNNWTGACPTAKSSCAAFVDPLSDFSVDLVTNNSFLRDLDSNSVPDTWKTTGDPLGNPSTYLAANGFVNAKYDLTSDPGDVLYKIIDISSNETYTLSSEIQDIGAVDALVKITCSNYTGSNDSCPLGSDQGFYLTDEMGELSKESCGTDIVQLRIPDAQLNLSTDKERYSLRFFSGSCNKVELIVGGDGSSQQFYSVSLKETGVYHYLDSSLADAKTECGFVNNDQGCVLLNNRDNASWKSLDYTDYLNYNADDTLAATPTSCLATDGFRFACNADTLMKVKPDRDCGKWLYCTTTEKIEGEEYCSNIGVCDKMDENGRCISNPLDYSNEAGEDAKTNMTFDKSGIDKIQNLSGYSRVGFNWTAGTIEGNLPPAQMTTLGTTANLLNGDFELTDYESKPFGWDVYLCGTAKTACVFDDDCPGVETCEGDNWKDKKKTSFSLINNPVDAQKANLDILNGSNILQLAAGNDNGVGHAVSEIININFGQDYVVSGYINTKDLKATKKIAIYGAIIVEGDITIAPGGDSRVANGYDWTLVQTVFKINDVNGGKIKIRLADIDENNNYCDSCGGRVYFDDISIRSVLQIDEAAIDQYIPRSCRLYPQSEALSCQYVNDDGFKYKGWHGYCLEQDPTYPEYCLNWYPVDSISGSDTVEEIGYDGQFPLYYCLEAAPYCDYSELIPHLYCSKVAQVVSTAGQNKYWAARVDSSSSYEIPFADSDAGAYIDWGPSDSIGREDIVIDYLRDGQPFGAIVPPDPINQPDEWDTDGDDANDVKTPLFIAHLDNEMDTARAGTPYYGENIACQLSGTTGGGCSTPFRCSGGGDEWFIRCPNNSVLISAWGCGTGSNWGWEQLSDGCRTWEGPNNAGGECCGIQCEENLEYNIASSFDEGKEGVERVFAKNYNAWDWIGSQNDGQYVPSAISWDVPSAECLGGVRPDWNDSNDDDYCFIKPKIENIKVNDKDVGESVLLASGSGVVTLKFNSVVDLNQLPLTSYSIDWGAGEITGAGGLAISDKPNENNPHIFTHEYRYTVLSPKDGTGTIVCGLDCSEDGGCKALAPTSKLKFCSVKPTVKLQDNWDIPSLDTTASTIYILSNL